MMIVCYLCPPLALLAAVFFLPVVLGLVLLGLVGWFLVELVRFLAGERTLHQEPGLLKILVAVFAWVLLCLWAVYAYSQMFPRS